MTIGLISILASAIFVLGYVGIVMEHTFHVNKAAYALLIGTLLWALAGIVNPESLIHLLPETSYEVFEIVAFLLAAMILVEILAHYRLFEMVKSKILSYDMSMKQQFVVIMIASFFLSSVINNLTVTIVMIQIASKLFWGDNRLVAAVGVVVAANAGGAFSPIGDITTLMLWLAGKFETAEIIVQAFLPSIALFAVATGMLKRKIVNENQIQEAKPKSITLTRGEKLILAVGLGSFILPLLAKSIGLPPFMGLLLGVGLTWLVVDNCKNISRAKTHATAQIERLVQKVDIASLMFFIGILMAISALNAMGILEMVSGLIFGDGESFGRIAIGSSFLGLFSALLDNIPLTAIAIEILNTPHTSLWVLLALTVGTGGSLLVIGSAAGVIAMGMVKDLTFKAYVQIAWAPVLVSYAFGIAVWFAQAAIMGLVPGI